MLTALLVSLLIFAILRIAPGDVALMIAMQGQEEVVLKQDEIDALREDLGLNAPLYVQYLSWIGGILTLDWGTSLFGSGPVWEAFKAKMPVTLELVIMAQTIAIVVGLPAGVIMALKRDTWIDYTVRIISLAGLSMPGFWTGTLLLVGGLYLFQWSPGFEYVHVWDDPIGNLSQFFWPAITLGYASLATKARMMRSTVLEVLRQDYVRTAHAKGLSNLVVTYRHVMKNSLIPVITVIGVTFALTMGGAVVIERVFNLPGIGNYLVDGMNRRDYPVVQSMITIFAIWVLMVNLFVDLAYGWLDPRIRYD